MKVTPWFDGKVKPAHLGVYERYWRTGFCDYSFWNGKRWGLPGKSPDEASDFPIQDSCRQDLPWRGIAKD